MGDLARNPSLYPNLKSNQRPFASWNNVQPTEPPWSELSCPFFTARFKRPAAPALVPVPAFVPYLASLTAAWDPPSGAPHHSLVSQGLDTVMLGSLQAPEEGQSSSFLPLRPWSQRMWGSESPGPHPVGIACAPSASVTGVSSVREERSLPNHGVSTAGSQEELRKHLLTKREWSFGSHRQAF